MAEHEGLISRMKSEPGEDLGMSTPAMAIEGLGLGERMFQSEETWGFRTEPWGTATFTVRVRRGAPKDLRRGGARPEARKKPDNMV